MGWHPDAVPTKKTRRLLGERDRSSDIQTMGHRTVTLTLASWVNLRVGVLPVLVGTLMVKVQGVTANCRPAIKPHVKLSYELRAHRS